MPPRKKAAVTAPSTMKELKDTLWKAADKLRGSMDASQYKDVILGLVFLKYVSDAFDERREQLEQELIADGLDEEGIASLIDDRDEYLGSSVFWVPEEARWSYLAQNAKGIQESDDVEARTVGELVNGAMRGLMAENATLTGTLPIIFNNPSVDQRRLGELIDMFNDTRFTGEGARRARDLLGEVYEYFLEKFARAEGKRGGEFYTPAGGCARSRRDAGTVQRAGVRPVLRFGWHVRAGREVHRSPRRQSGRYFGVRAGTQRAHVADGEDESRHSRITAQLGPKWEDTFAHDVHPDLLADFVMANPPFNIKDWTRREDDKRWKFGVPPAATRTTRGFSTSCRNSPNAAAPVWSWPTERCRRIPVVKAISGLDWSRPTRCRAWSRCRHSCSAAREFRCACGSSRRIRRRGRRFDRPAWAGTVHRCPQPRLHGRPRGACALGRGHCEDRRNVPRLARNGIREGCRIRRRGRLLLLSHARRDQGR